MDVLIALIVVFVVLGIAIAVPAVLGLIGLFKRNRGRTPGYNIFTGRWSDEDSDDSGQQR